MNYYCSLSLLYKFSKSEILNVKSFSSSRTFIINSKKIPV
nr:MAG TPA: hypothetical protein [Caudoviricetes sp.]